MIHPHRVPSADDLPGRRHIVFVSLVFPPDSSASSMLFGDLFLRMASGLRITVLCGFPSKDPGVDLQTVPRREWLGDVEVIRCGPRIPGKRSFAFRALAYGGFLVDASRHLLRTGRRVTVVGSTDPPFAPLVLAALSLICRWRYQQILLDLYPDGLVGVGNLAERTWFIRLWRALNRLAFARPERIIAIGRDMVERLQAQYGVSAERLTYLPLWGNAEVDARAVVPPLPARGGDIGARIRIQYSGNMGLWHDIDTMVRAASLVVDEPAIQFTFIGKGMRRAAAEQLARQLSTSNIRWADFVPRERLAESVMDCDAALISLRPGLSGVAVPSKLYGILASGRAAIAQVPEDSEVSRVVREERCGVVVEPGSASALAEAIRALSGDQGAMSQMGERARQAYIAKYTLAAAVQRFTDLWV